MARSLWFKLFLLGTGLLLVCMPFYQWGMPVWVGVVLMSLGAAGQSIVQRPKLFSSGFIALLVLYLLMQVVGVFYSPVPETAWTNVFLKLSLLLLPLSTFLVADHLSKKEVVFGLNLFHVGCLGSSLFHLVKGSIVAKSTGRTFVFYEEFSVLMHPAYLSLMLCCAIIIGLYLRSKDHWGTKLLGAYYKPLTTVILLATIFLLSSRIQMLAIFSVLALLAIVRVTNRASSFKAKTISLALIVFALGFGAVMVKSNDRVGSTIKELSDVNLKPGDNLTSTAVRLIAWQICWDNLIASPILGHGTASCKTRIKESELSSNHPQFDSGQLGAHNQYLNAGVNHGFPGLILLALMLLVPLRIGIRNKNAMLIGTVLLAIISLITESMFEREAGVVIFAMLVPLSWLYKRRIGFAQ